MEIKDAQVGKKYRVTVEAVAEGPGAYIVGDAIKFATGTGLVRTKIYVYGNDPAVTVEEVLPAEPSKDSIILLTTSSGSMYHLTWDGDKWRDHSLTYNWWGLLSYVNAGSGRTYKIYSPKED